MIETLVPRIAHLRIARTPTLVCAADASATPEAIAERIPGVERGLRMFGLPTTMRVRERGFRRYALTPILVGRWTGSIDLDIIRAHIPEGDDLREDGDSISFRGHHPVRPLRIRFDGMQDNLWGLSSPSGVARDAGTILATGLGALRSFASGMGTVDRSDALESCRLANIHWNLMWRNGDTDPTIMDMLGGLRELSTFPMTWSIRIDDDGDMRIRPVIARADPDTVDMMTIMRAMAGAHRIMERAIALGIAPEGSAA